MFKFTALKRLRPRSGYDVVAVLAMCVALGSGSAYAAELFTGADVVDETLTDADIQDGSLKTAIQDSAITSKKVAPNSIIGGLAGHVVDGSITGNDVAEFTLGKVPTAHAADTATSAPISGYMVQAGSGSSVDGYVIMKVSCPGGRKVLGYTARRADGPSGWDPIAVASKLDDDNTAVEIKADESGEGYLWVRVQVTCAFVG